MEIINDNSITISDESVACINVSINGAETIPFKEHYIKEKQKQVSLPGFRKGKVPSNMIAKYFKDEIQETANSNAIYTKYLQILQDHKLQPLTAPKLEIVSTDNDVISARINVDVLQPVALGQYLGLEVNKLVQPKIEDSLQNTLQEIKKMYPKLEDSTEPAKSGNVVVIDFVLSQDGKELEKQQDFRVHVGSNMFFADFEAQLIGMNKEESKEFDLHFPETYQNDILKNKDVHFNIFVKAVKNVFDYTDEELAKLLGYETTENMMGKLTDEIVVKQNNDEKLNYENQILGKLLETHAFKIPSPLLNNEIQKIQAEKPDMPYEEIVTTADKFIRTDLILRAIYERHPDIHLQQAEFDKKIAELAARANDSVENLVKKLQETNKIQAYVNYLQNCKTIDFLIEMSVKEKENG